MATVTRGLREIWSGRGRREAKAAQPSVAPRPSQVGAPLVDIAPDDPIIAYFLSAQGAVEIDNLPFDSPAVRELKGAGVKLSVPLVSQGELVGVLNLGPRLSQQEYSADDRGLLSNLATQAAPAVRVAQLVREQQDETAARERIEHELRVARLIQQTLLPKELPALPGWQLAAYYQPARAVGGDFYDFLYLPDGRVGIVIGDVTDKGVPAALVMATTRSIIRGAAQNGESPGVVLQRTNDMLGPDIPPKMFVTCFYGILDPVEGKLVYANAGHDLPYLRHKGGVSELRATGMPLGLMPGMHYDEKEAVLTPGDSVILYSDGLVEAHNKSREMFSFRRLMSLMKEHEGGVGLIEYLLGELARFTGEDWEQEDDVCMVALERTGGQGVSMVTNAAPAGSDGNTLDSYNAEQGENYWRVLDAWDVPSEPGNERQVMERVAKAVGEVGLSQRRLEQLKTAVAEATMNAMEHGNKYDPELEVHLQVRASDRVLSVLITDEGGSAPIPERVETPNLQAKLEGLQTPRGWGLFLIENLVDEMHITSDGTHDTLELVIRLEGDK